MILLWKDEQNRLGHFQLPDKQDLIFLWTTFDASEGQEMDQIKTQTLWYQNTYSEKPDMEKEGNPKLCLHTQAWMRKFRFLTR